jgi:hypothetical protein
VLPLAVGAAGAGSQAGSAGDTFVPIGGDAQGGTDAAAGADPGTGGSASGSGGSSVSGGAGGSAGTTGSGGTSGAGGVSATGGTSSGGSAGSSGSGGASSVGDLIVTTNADENDAGATVAAPGGTGLSLREAITIANASAGSQTITFQSGIVVALASALPIITDTVQILGGEVNCAAVGANANCLNLAASSSVIDGLRSYDSGGRPIYVTGGTNSQITNCSFDNNRQPLEISANAGLGNVIGPNNLIENAQGHAVAVYSDGASVIDNVISDSANNAIFLSGTANDTLIRGNLLLRAGTAIGMASGTTNVRIWHNTIVYNSVTGVVVGQANGIDLRNNIIAFNTQYAVNAADVKFTQQDYNLMFGNTSGDCVACTPGPNSVLTDPQFVNAAADDFALGATSPALNAGTDLGVDRNGASAGNFNGAAPDLGYLEGP